MAYKCREEIVGKRFLSVRSSGKLKLSKISEWEWRSGVVRALTARDTSNVDISILVEFDDRHWQRREWVRIHDIFQVFLVEHTLVWAERPDPENSQQPIIWPGLNFRSVVDKVCLSSSRRKPVEFVSDKYLGLVEDKCVKSHQESDEARHHTLQHYPQVGQAVKEWLDYQDGQKILLTTPTVLVGYRVEVYRAEGTTQWYTAVIQSYNHTTKTLSVTDDTVLEEHNEDPALIQMRLIDDGVVDSILRGVEIGIGPRRTRQTNKDKEQQSNVNFFPRNTIHNIQPNTTSTPERASTGKTQTSRGAKLRQTSTSQGVQQGAASTVNQASDVDKEKANARPKLPRDRKRKTEKSDEQKDSNKPEQINLCLSNVGKRTKSAENKRISAGLLEEKKAQSPSPLKRVRSTDFKKSASNYYTDHNEDSESLKQPVVAVTRRSKPVVNKKPRVHLKKCDPRKSHRTSSSPVISRSKRQRPETKRSVRKISENRSATPLKSSPRFKTDSPSRIRQEKRANFDKSHEKDLKNRTKHSVKLSFAVFSSVHSEESHAEYEKGEASVDSEELSENCDTDNSKCSETELLSSQAAQETVCVKESSQEKENENSKPDSASNTPKDNLGEENESDSNCVQCDNKETKKECTSSDSEQTVSDSTSDQTGESTADNPDNMHFMKQRLLAGTNPSESSNKPSPSSLPGIDVTRSVTDQIKLARTEKLNLHGDETSNLLSSRKSVSPSSHSERDSSEIVEQGKDARQNFDNVVNTSNSFNIATSHSSNSLSSVSYYERSNSRASEHSSSGYGDDRRPASRLDDLKTSGKNSPASSPLIIDKAEPVHPYRDPELMRKNPVQSNVQGMLGGHKSSTYPNVHTPIPSAPPSATSMPTTTSFPTHPLPRTHVLSSIPYHPQALSALGAASLLPSPLDHATLAALQQQQLALQYNNSLLLQRAGASGYPPPAQLTMAQLELLWQQKYPSVPTPPQWMLASKQEDLLRDIFNMKEREIERYERERLERVERERLERERLERLEREKIERDRQIERERQERERLERERLEKAERERAERERAERERLEKEMMERERERELERKKMEYEREQRQERERILKESADTLAAVDDHFQQSLRLAKQRAAQTGMWTSPSITLGTGKSGMKSEGSSQQSPSLHSYDKSERSKQDIVKSLEEKVRQERDQDMRHHSYSAEAMRKQEMANAIRQHETERLLAAKQEEYIKHAENRERQIKALSEQLKSEKMDKSQLSRGDVKPPQSYVQSQGFKSYPTSTTTSSSNSSVKQEPNFNLYGYQPFQHSYISPEQLQEKMNMDSKHSVLSSSSGRSSSPKRSKTSVPPPLIKDIKSHSSVIVENKGKESGKSSSPRPAHSHYSSSTVPIPSNSPRPQPKPAHTPDRHHDRPRSAMSSSSPLAASYHDLSSQSMDLSSSGTHMSFNAMKGAESKHIIARSQSPISMTSQQQQLAAAMLGQPLDYHFSSGKPRTSPVGSGKSVSTSLPSHSVQSSSQPSSSHHLSAAIAQPPVSLPAGSVAYSYSLIQQGLVPNPIYSQSTVKSVPLAHSDQQKPNTASIPMSSASQLSSGSSGAGQGQGVKRKVNREGGNRKRQKPENSGGNVSSSSGLSVPVTTPQIMSNRSPYTTTSSTTCTTVSSVLSNVTMTTSAVTTVSSTSTSASSSSSSMLYSPSSNPSTAASFMSNSSLVSGSTTASGFMDSFKSFVENAVQNAFYQDQELNRQKSSSSGNKHNNQEKQQKPAGQSPPPQLGQIPSPQQQSQQQTPPTSLQQQQRRKSDPLQLNEDSSSLTLSSSSSSISSSHTLMETINRVANGQIDTDSDTLSAPSPPPHFKSGDASSPHKSGNHPKLKKAWLQRHSDEDKELKNSPFPQGDNSQKSEILKNCYVNCSYISPSKEGGSRSPISALRLNGNIKDISNDDESTTSASETETAQNPDAISGKKRPKAKRNNTNTKKMKHENLGEEGANNPAPTKKKGSKKNRDKDANKEASAKSGSKNKETSEDERNHISNKKLSDDIPIPPAKKERKEKEPKYSSEQVQLPTPASPTETGVLPLIDTTMETSPAAQPPSQLSSSVPPVSSSSSTSSTNSSSGKPEKEKKEKKHRKHKEKENSGNNTVNNNNNKDKEQQQTPPPPPPPPPQQQQQHQQHQSPVETITRNNGSSFNKPLVKASVATLKKTCQPFLQDGSCSEVTPKLMKCRECKMTPTQRSKKLPNIFCRFYAFRRLRYSQKGFLTIAGFSELSDAEYDDIEPWLPHVPVMEPKMDVETSKYVVAKIGDKFCELVQQEREARSCAEDEAKITWKRAVTGVREMCDVCDTTLFNMHWVCHKCGFVVCLDCYKVRMRALKQEEAKDRGEELEEDPNLLDNMEDQRRWLTCSSNRQQHEVDKLLLTQIIPRDALWEVGRLIHEIRAKWNIPSKCPCGQNNKYLQKNGISQKYMNALNHISGEKNKKMVNGIGDDHKSHKGSKKHDQQAINGNVKSSLGGYSPDNSPLRMLADVASMDSENSRERSESPYSKRRGDNEKYCDKYGKSYNPITEPVSPISGDKNTGDTEGEKKNPTSCSTLRELLTKTAGKVKTEREPNKKSSKSKNMSSTLDDIIQSVVEKQLPRDIENSQPVKLMHYIPRFGYSGMIARDTPILVHNLTETSVLYPDVPHSWLCDGRLLRLHDPKHKGNFKIFQEQMKRGQPVLVSGVDKCLNRELWHPRTFSKMFGKQKNDLVNTRNGCLIVGHPMAVFWDGFGTFSERLVDDQGDPILLKLKDWPPGDDFSDLMPQHFEDLMQSLPLPEYTHRQGKLNLASRLPDFLVRPDLGPKMYNAYGSADHPSEGTTNLHLDVSDAVNVMVYVGIPDDGPGGKSYSENAALKAIDEAGCDMITKRRVREVHEIPGAMWQIFDARDADKMRDFLNKVAKERGEVIEPHHDPIHDQSWYLDEDLRDRLYKEYGVLGYTIVQCLGDAVFIPAGAPHQVRNLHSCIKVAEDFVSPEHLNHCFGLTQEFRLLSDTHSNHEDKLQVKNIVYHAVKDALAVLDDADPDDE